MLLLGVTEPLLVRFSGADPGFFLRGEDAPLRYGALTDWWRDVPNYHFYGVSHKFFNLVSCFTSTLTNHTVFFAHVISGRGGRGAHSLHPSPRSPLLLFWYGYCLLFYQTFVLRHSLIAPVCNTRKVSFWQTYFFEDFWSKKTLKWALELVYSYPIPFKLKPRSPFRV